MHTVKDDERLDSVHVCTDMKIRRTANHHDIILVWQRLIKLLLIFVSKYVIKYWSVTFCMAR